MISRPCLAPLLALLALALAGCGRGNDDLLEISVIGSDADLRENGGANLSITGQMLRSATAEGLVSFGPEGDVQPAIAERWIVTDDGRSYIFRLRDSSWPGGAPLTSDSAAAALRESIAALRGTPLGLDLANIEEVRSMTGRVIEIRLAAPTPDLLQLLAQPELGLRRRSGGKGQPGVGPMSIDRLQKTVILTPLPPEKRGLPVDEDWADASRKLLIRSEKPSAAVARFNEGYADMVTGGRIDSFTFADLTGLSRGNVRLDPVTGLFGLIVLHDDGFLSDAQRREALALAVDREALMQPFNIAGWQATTRFVPPGLAGDPETVGERWSNLTIEDRQALARARVDEWRAANGSTPRLRLAMPEGPGARILFARLKSDMAKAGIDLVRVSQSAEADLRLVDTVSRYGRALWFLNQLSCQAGRRVCSTEADTTLKEARLAVDPAQRAQLLAEAEQEMTGANGFIPFGAPIRWSLVRSDVEGFAPNPWGWHPLFPLAVPPT